MIDGDKKLPGGPVLWEGDLSDDCHATWNGFGAHVECMYAYDPDDHEEDETPNDPESWYCSVWKINPEAKVGADHEQLFHSSGDDIHPLSGEAARRLCELVMREAYMRERWVW